MIGAALLHLWGTTRVYLYETRSYVTTGVGIFRWKKSFDATQVTSVGITTTRWQSEGGQNQQIEIMAHKSVTFGSMLKPHRMEWMRMALKGILLQGHYERLTNS